MSGSRVLSLLSYWIFISLIDNVYVLNSWLYSKYQNYLSYAYKCIFWLDALFKVDRILELDNLQAIRVFVCPNCELV